MTLDDQIRAIVRDELAKARPANDANSGYLSTAEAARFASVTPGTRGTNADLRRAVELEIDRISGCCSFEGWTYLLRGAGLVKIGMSLGDVVQRISKIQSHSPVRLELVVLGRAPQLESVLHDRLFMHRRHCEWFAEDVLVDLRSELEWSRTHHRCLRCAMGRP